LTPDDVELVQKQKGVRVVKSLQTTQTEGNPKMAKKSPLHHKSVRQAINYAIDKEAIVEGVYRNVGKCITGPASPRLTDAVDFGCWPYDPDKARQLLSDAGYPDGFTLKWGYTKRSGGFDEMVQAVQAYLANVGIQMTIEKYAGLAEASPAASQLMDTYTDPPTMFQFIHTSPFLQYHLARLYMTRPYDQKSVYNIGYSNPRVDELLTATSAEFDDEKRQSLFQEAQRIIWEDAAQIWLYQPEALVGVSDRIENFVMSTLMEPWIEVWRVRPTP
jgi:ABC-type transport system substrate-binding protein